MGLTLVIPRALKPKKHITISILQKARCLLLKLNYSFQKGLIFEESKIMNSLSEILFTWSKIHNIIECLSDLEI